MDPVVFIFGVAMAVIFLYLFVVQVSEYFSNKKDEEVLRKIEEQNEKRREYIRKVQEQDSKRIEEKRLQSKSFGASPKNKVEYDPLNKVYITRKHEDDRSIYDLALTSDAALIGLALSHAFSEESSKVVPKYEPAEQPAQVPETPSYPSYTPSYVPAYEPRESSYGSTFSSSSYDSYSSGSSSYDSSSFSSSDWD